MGLVGMHSHYIVSCNISCFIPVFGSVTLILLLYYYKNSYKNFKGKWPIWTISWMNCAMASLHVHEIIKKDHLWSKFKNCSAVFYGEKNTRMHYNNWKTPFVCCNTRTLFNIFGFKLMDPQTRLKAILKKEDWIITWKTIAFAARKNSDTEKNYPTKKHENLAKHAVSNRWEILLRLCLCGPICAPITHPLPTSGYQQNFMQLNNDG